VPSCLDEFLASSSSCPLGARRAQSFLAQVAEQQGKYLAKCLNDEARGHKGPPKPFVYHHLGSMASLGKHLTFHSFLSCLLTASLM
jgi:NADH dehydrogenase FAD-containing subunit